MYFGPSNQECQLNSVPGTVIAGRVFIGGIFWLARHVDDNIGHAKSNAKRLFKTTHFVVEKE